MYTLTGLSAESSVVRTPTQHIKPASHSDFHVDDLNKASASAKPSTSLGNAIRSMWGGLRIGRLVGIVFGISTQVLFLWTAYHLFLFLRFGTQSTATFSPAIDLALAMFFAWPHSLLLLPTVSSRMRKIMPSGLLGCVHCVATCVSLLSLFAIWSKSSIVLWNFDGQMNIVMLVGFYGSWGALFYSLYLTGMGYQTGFLPWAYWVAGRKPPLRKFDPQGCYRWMRHPVYLSFLGLIWFTPIMTLDHALLTLVWTVYIFLGSFLKDRRLLHYIGQPYREYASRVVGFPIIGFGPWGKLRMQESSNPQNAPCC